MTKRDRVPDSDSDTQSGHAGPVVVKRHVDETHISKRRKGFVEIVEISSDDEAGKAENDPLSLAFSECKNMGIFPQNQLASLLQRFANDALFRLDVTRMLEPPRPASQSPWEGPTFPFMRLPLEIRRMICEEALCYSEGLEFTWTSHYPRKNAGTFVPASASHGNFNALPLVSRDLYHETAGLVFALNELHFGCQGFTLEDEEEEISFLSRSRLESQQSIVGFLLFMASCSNSTTSKLRRVWIWSSRMNAPQESYSSADVEDFFKLTNQFPRIDIRFRETLWFIYPDATRDFTRDFIQMGRQLIKGLSDNAPQSKRPWRVHPGISTCYMSMMLKIEFAFLGDELAVIRDWMRNGI